MNYLIQIVRIGISLIGGIVVAFFLNVILGVRILPPIILMAICVLALWFLLPRVVPFFENKPRGPKSGPITIHVNGKTFEATHHTKNIAINAATGQMWFRDDKGRQWLLDRSQIRTWTHEWRDISNNYGAVASKNNFLVLTTNDVDHPTHRIPMGGHFQHQLAKEWSARLTAFLDV